MTYNWKMMDERSKQEARRIRSQAGGSLMDENSENGFKLLVGGLLLVATIAVATSGAVLLAFPLWLVMAFVVFGNPSTNQAVHDGFDEWLKWRKEREDEYYGIFKLVEWRLVKHTVLGTAKSEYDKIDMWKCGSHHSFARMEPEDYLIKMSDGSYDYGKYFEELAYRHQIMCYRYGYEPHIVNWAEAISYIIWGGYTDYRTASYKPMVESCDKDVYSLLPFEKYPMNKQQDLELMQFDYRAYDEGGAWVKGVWKRAEDRFNADKAKYGHTAYENPDYFILEAEAKCKSSYLLEHKPHKDGDRIDRELAYKDYKNA